MRVLIDAPESFEGLYEVRLYFLPNSSRCRSERILYLPDVAGACYAHDCNPLPSVSRVARSVRKTLGLKEEDSLLRVLAVNDVPRFDDYDEVYGLAFGLGLLVPHFDAREIKVAGEMDCDETVNDVFLKIAKELEPFRARGYVVGGQRRMACELAKGRSYKTRPLEWLCVSEQAKD